MPNIQSAKKRMRQAARQQTRNRASRSRVTGMRRAFLAAVAGGDQAQSGTAFRAYCAALDRAAKRGAIKANNANRHKSRAAARLANLPPPAGPA